MLCFEAANCHCCRLGRAVGKSRGICKIEKGQRKKKNKSKLWAPTLKTYGKKKKKKRERLGEGKGNKMGKGN